MRSFTVPSGLQSADALDVERAKEKLATCGFRLHTLERWLERDELGDLYDDVSSAKAKVSRDEKGPGDTKDKRLEVRQLHYPAALWTCT